MKDNKKTYSVIGLGFVGKQVFDWFKNKKYEVYGYSLDYTKDEEKAFSSDVVFVCVPTPINYKTKRYDLSIVESVVKKIKSGSIVVIKSTVTIGTTEKIQKDNPDKFILFNPEFLSEATCEQDYLFPDRQIIGYTSKSEKYANEILEVLPDSPYNVIIPSKEGELIKLINNINGALSVVQTNIYYDVCLKEHLDYQKVKEGMEASKYVSKYYHEPIHKGKRGFSGHCFIKEIFDFDNYLKRINVDNSLLSSAIEYNNKLLASQGLTPQIAEQVGSEEDLKRIRGY